VPGDRPFLLDRGPAIWSGHAAIVAVEVEQAPGERVDVDHARLGGVRVLAGVRSGEAHKC
jgi:hypothetical protein